MFLFCPYCFSFLSPLTTVTGYVKIKWYDAWGNHVVTNTNLPQLALCNPFRYRGYYYDVETGLYYCNARYYSPKLCRWISPDSIGY
ncbi:MAG: RHS repeat-associated core domain-containing protein, partial [Clostridia bacterium]|nr:RHS repeat-associated core domain-containing protein [Clostridia bacterium]